MADYVIFFVDFHPLVPFLPQAYRLNDKEAQIDKKNAFFSRFFYNLN